MNSRRTKSTKSAPWLSDPNWLLDQLDPEQQKVALQTHGPLCVRAGAGTGKTRAITYRIAYGAAVGAFDPGQVLAVTFTRKSALEMQSRLVALGAERAKAKTFHSAALQQLHYFWPRVYGREIPRLRESKLQLVATAASRMELPVAKDFLADLASEIQWAKVMMVGPDQYVEVATAQDRSVPGQLTPAQFAEVFDLYQQIRREQGVIDFEDVLLLCVGMLRTNPEVSRQVRRRYSLFVVDEYQDVSPVQQALLDLWLADRKDLCVVGDASQTIYSFSGASSEYLVNFQTRYPGANVVELYRNYRSTPEIVDLANRIILQGEHQGSVRLVSQQESGPIPTFCTYPTEADEAKGVAAQICRLLSQGVKASEIAILLRTNAQSIPFEAALSAQGISFQVRGGDEFFKRPEIRQAIVEMRRMTLLQRIAAEPNAPAQATKLPDSLVELVRLALRSQGWSEAVPLQRGHVRERWDNLNALVELAKTNAELELDEFLEELAVRAEVQAAPSIEGITITTFHTAKGLEWEAVFLAGLSEGLVPISYAQTLAEIEEERRLFYVGASRARKILEMSWAQKISEDRTKSRRLSRFAASIWDIGRDRANSVANSSSRSSAPKLAEQLFFEQASELTLQIYQALWEWRVERATDLQVLPAQVLSNVTLRAIATAKPKTLKQLVVLRGLSDKKMQDFGATILKIVEEKVKAAKNTQ